jgi:hypothetical protein
MATEWADTWILGAPGQRPDHITATARRSVEVRKEERMLEIHALITVQLDARVRLQLSVVKQEAARQLRVPASELGVIRLTEATFLLNFSDSEQRNVASHRGIRIGNTCLKLLPWSRCVGADSELVRYRYRARLCIEGVPSHVRQPEAIATLFKNCVFIDELHCEKEKP